MSDKQHSFIIPDEQSISVLVSLLQKNFSVRIQPETVYHRVFYDTFDWRLTRYGSALEAHDDGPSPRIYWRADKDGRSKIQLGLRKVPRLACDLPACAFRRQLQSIISVRELSPHIKIRIKRKPLTVLDEHQKVVVRLYFDVYWYSPSRLRAARVLTRRLTVKAVKGYAEEYQRVYAFFVDMPLPRPLTMPLQTAHDNVMKLALIAGGVSTDEYTTSMNLWLDPFMPDEQALKMILLRLLEILQQNTAGSIKGRDTEFMHDYRVALRKIRVVLKHLGHHHPSAVSSEYRRFFSGLGKFTNPIRDLDVFLMQLENYQPDFENSGWQQLQPLRDYLLLSRAEAQKKLIEDLKSSRYRKTIKQWHDYLNHSVTEEIMTDKPGKPVYKLADELLWEINQKTLEQGKTITRNSDAETLHDLRKSFKQLRYLTEFFSSLYPAVELRVLIQSLTDIQDNLGIYNDRHVQAGMVQAFIQQSKNKEAIKASEQLIQILQQQQDEAGKNFKDDYKKYASSASQKKFRELFVDYHQGKMKL
jgi:CHAD domain-containing protein